MTRTCTVGEAAFASRLSVLSRGHSSATASAASVASYALRLASGPEEGREGARIPEPEWELRQVLARGGRPVLGEVSTQHPAAEDRETLGGGQ